MAVDPISIRQAANTPWEQEKEVTYRTSFVYLDEGAYTLVELEELVAFLKRINERNKQSARKL